MKLFPQGEKPTLKDFFNDKLEKLFDSAPSNFGYKADIEALLIDLGITKEHLLQMVINCLSKSVRNKQEIKTIASYLFFMQDFLKLIKAKGVSEKETILLKDLLTLSEAMIYEKQQKNTVMMRYGEKGSTAYIILNGQVDVLIETSSFKNLGEKSYLYYLANLIKYHEFGLVNLAVNDNFKKFPIEIIDDITIKTNNNNITNNDNNNNINNINNNNPINDIKNNIKNDNIKNDNINNNDKNINRINNINNIKNIIKNNLNNNKKIKNNQINIVNQNKILYKSTNNSINNNMIKDNIINNNNNININNEGNIRNDKYKRTIKRIKGGEGDDNNNENPSSSRKNDNTKRETQQKGLFRLNFMNEELKDIKKVKKYRAKELLEMFGLKLLDKRLNKKLNRCDTEEYIQRLNIFDYLEKKQKKMEEKIMQLQNSKNFKNMNINTNLNINTNINKFGNNLSNKKEKINKSIKIIKKEEKKEEKKENINMEKKIKKTSDKNTNNNVKKPSRKNTISDNNENTENNNNDDENNDDESEDNQLNNKSSSSSSSSFMFEMNHNMIFGLKIYTYMKVVTLGMGSLFGEMALNDSNALRKATIITSGDCHFSVLNKKTFNNCIKMGAQKHLRELLQFFIELPIFCGIPEGVFYHKYYTNLSKFAIIKGKNIINQGEKPEHITLLQTGLYGVTTRMSLFDLTRLIFKFVKYFNINNESYIDKKNSNNTKENNSNNINDIKNKYRILFQNVINLMNEENTLLNDNIIFKKFYYSKQFIRIAEISCPEVIINEEYMDENGVFAFSIEAKAPENIIYTLNNQFYDDLKNKNISVKKNQDKLLSKKINLMIQRLLIIRNSLISSFFDYKSRNEVGASVIRELEDMIIIQLKKKRSLIKKDEKIIKTNENENKENKDKEKEILNNINSTDSNSYLVKNKKNDINKYYKETGSSLIENNSYSNKNNNNNNNNKNIVSIKLYKEIENNKKQENKGNKKLYNRKFSYKFSKDKKIKFSNNYLNMYKKVLSSSPNKKLNITNKDLNAINQFPYKDNDEDFLISLYDKNDTDGKYIISNYKNKMASTNYDISRNHKNQFTQMKNKFEKNTIFNSYGNNKSDEQKNNNYVYHSTKKVLINNLIWENIKSVMKFPPTKKFNLNNFSKTSNNFYKNKSINNNNNLRKYLENNFNLKCITNRNKNKISKNSKTEENKLTKTYNNEKNNSLTKGLSFTNIKVENINNVYLLSSPSDLQNNVTTIKSSIQQNKRKESRIKDKNAPPPLNLKKNNNINDLPNIHIKLKKFYSPQEINFMRMSRKMRFVMDGNKYNKIKGEKFKINRNVYYKKNIINRMNFFYGYSPEEK